MAIVHASQSEAKNDLDATTFVGAGAAKSINIVTCAKIRQPCNQQGPKQVLSQPVANSLLNLVAEEGTKALIFSVDNAKIARYDCRTPLRNQKNHLA
jgi:hypothetical protein